MVGVNADWFIQVYTLIERRASTGLFLALGERDSTVDGAGMRMEIEEWAGPTRTEFARQALLSYLDNQEKLTIYDQDSEVAKAIQYATAEHSNGVWAWVQTSFVMIIIKLIVVCWHAHLPAKFMPQRKAISWTAPTKVRGVSLQYISMGAKLCIASLSLLWNYFSKESDEPVRRLCFASYIVKAQAVFVFNWS